MSKWVLFMMFFVSPPSSPGSEVWSLHNTEHFEFQTKAACQKFGVRLQARLLVTGTVRMRGWCVDDSTGEGTFDVKNPFEHINDGDDPNIYEIPTKSSDVKKSPGK
jgi:hypothetical protein